MDEALRLAARGRGQTSPNPMVGALVVSGRGEVVGAGYHERAGLPHAEVLALEAASGRTGGATLFSTLEPCCHTGRTGPCVERILAARIGRVVVAIEDPNPLVNGAGVDWLRQRGIAVTVGVRGEEAERLNEVFFTWMRRHRPFVILKIATSLDGRIAARAGVATPLSSPESHAYVHHLRAEVDAVAVGSETVLVDDPRLTARGVPRTRPLVRVVFDRRLRTPPSSRLFQTLDAGGIWIVTDEADSAERRLRAQALGEAGATLVVVPGDIRAALTELGRRQVTSLLLEGGAVLHAAAVAAGAVDRVALFVAPIVLGPAGVPWLGDPRVWASGLRELRTGLCGPDTFIEGYVHRTD